MPIDLNEHLKNKRAQMNSDNKSSEPKRDNNNKPPFGGGSNFDGFNNLNNFVPSGKKLTILLILIAIVLILVIQRPFVIINSGEVGIKATTGKYEPTPLQPGLHFFIPFFQEVIVVDTRVRTINFSRSEDMGAIAKNQGIFRNDAINVLDSRGLTVMIELTVQYQLNDTNAPLTISVYGLSWEQKIINPVVRDVVRSVVGRYPAEELPTKRDDIAKEIALNMENEVKRFKNDPVILTSVQLREIVLPEKIKAQIEQVQVARQEAERVRYEVDRAKQEAEKVAALAKGEADANRVKAQGVADAITIEAKAQSQANKLIADSLSQRLLDLRQIEVQGKFNEALKENNNAQIFLAPGGSVPNIWVDSKSKRQSTVSAQ
ncbi:SPFH domain-containing protein [uncultured Helicobacter sp.]|uniref:prohibitin family protein n=1 Tax=uncultured Helicobacter sp. TaxID=175537 RepID=UPI0037527E74